MAYTFNREERLITVEKLCVSYDKPILRDISFEIDNITRPGLDQGQLIAILGPSGIGKTQLLRCLSGLQKPNSGDVWLSNTRDPGKIADRHSVEAGQVGVVQQHYPLLMHRTVWGNLMVVSDDKPHAEELLARVGLADKKHHYPHQLSGGQRQRVAIVQQLLCAGHFLLMDEPFSGLDPVAKIAMCKLITGICTLHEHNTIILSTHDLESALQTADTVFMLGRERDADGNVIPGAVIRKEICLIDRGLAWRPDIDQQPAYYPTLHELKETFLTL